MSLSPLAKQVLSYLHGSRHRDCYSTQYNKASDQDCSHDQFVSEHDLFVRDTGYTGNMGISNFDYGSDQFNSEASLFRGDTECQVNMGALKSVGREPVIIAHGSSGPRPDLAKMEPLLVLEDNTPIERLNPEAAAFMPTRSPPHTGSAIRSLTFSDPTTSDVDGAAASGTEPVQSPYFESPMSEQKTESSTLEHATPEATTVFDKDSDSDFNCTDGSEYHVSFRNVKSHLSAAGERHARRHTDESDPAPQTVFARKRRWSMPEVLPPCYECAVWLYSPDASDNLEAEHLDEVAQRAERGFGCDGIHAPQPQTIYTTKETTQRKSTHTRDNSWDTGIQTVDSGYRTSEHEMQQHHSQWNCAPRVFHDMPVFCEPREEYLEPCFDHSSEFTDDGYFHRPETDHSYRLVSGYSEGSSYGTGFENICDMPIWEETTNPEFNGTLDEQKLMATVVGGGVEKSSPRFGRRSSRSEEKLLGIIRCNSEGNEARRIAGERTMGDLKLLNIIKTDAKHFEKRHCLEAVAL
ncbi:hypothetical protein MKZ38_005865 [Zalerion maritima]|uniref:Uncharacterized protein n=1 Tax=Zalerion maritima TaxID=339359 RepID=A0AAD5RK65_9PEZI|nr:hypothetical protein MKZ38_005865 [Zalerion maritima]